MRTRLVPYTPFGSARDPLPDALESQVVTPLGELSTASVHYHREGVNAPVLDGVVELGFEFWNNGAWVEPPNCRFLSMRGSFDHLEQTPTRKYSFVGMGWMLRRAKVWEPNGLQVDEDGKVQFLSANAGTIMATLIQSAKGRGWGAGVSIDFDSTTDSSGAAWDSEITIAYDLDMDLETILENLYQQGVCDFRWEGRTLRVFNPDAAMGRDLTVGDNPVRLVVADGQTSAPEEWTNEDMLTDALVLGEEGKSWKFDNGANNPLGRLESVITQGGVSEEGTASLLAQADLLAGSQSRISYTREFVVTPDSRVWPFRDYVPGDWVSGQRGTGFERLRTHSLSLTVNADGVKGHAVLGDRLADLLTKLAKRQRGITGGASAGGSGVRPAPEGPDTRTPSTPQGLVVGVDAYLDNDGAAQGRAALDWAHDGTATNGTAMDIDRFQVYYRENKVGAIWRELGSTQESELNASPLPLMDGGQPAEFAFKVRAIGENSKISAFTPVVTVVMEPDTTPPPVPEFRAQDLTANMLNVYVNATGKGVLADLSLVDMPGDFSHFNAYQGTSPSGPWELAGLGVGAGLVHVTRALPAEVTVWYALTSVDRSGNESELSAVQSVTPTANVDMGDYFDHLDAAQVTISNAGKVLLESGEELGGKLTDQDNIFAAIGADGGPTGVAEKVEGEITLGLDQLAVLGTANINTAVIDELWSKVVRSRQISTDMLRVGNGNLVLDPSFVASPIRSMRLSVASPEINPTFTQQSDGLFYFRANSATATTADFYAPLRTGPVTAGNMISVTPGDMYSLECEVWADSGVAWLPQVDVLYGNNAAGSLNVTETSVQGAGGGFQRFTFDFTVPAGVAEVYPRFRFNAGSVGFFRLRSPSFKYKVGASLIVDGDVLARHLTVTEEMWAKVVKFQLLSGDEIDTNSLTSDTGFIGDLKTNSLVSDIFQGKEFVGGTFVGADIKSSDTPWLNGGFQFTADQLRVWDTTGKVVLSADGATGNLLATGTIRTDFTGNRVELYDDNDGGDLRFWSGANRGSLKSRASVGRLSMVYNDLNGNDTDLPFVGVEQARALMQYRGQKIMVGGTTAADQYMELDAGGGEVVLRGNLDMRTGRTRYRYGNASDLAYIGQRPEQGSNARMEIRTEIGLLQLSTDGLMCFAIYDNTTTLSSNVQVDGTGRLRRSSSASRYKLDQRELTVADSLLDVGLYDWLDKGQVEKKAEMDKLPRPLRMDDQLEVDAIHMRRTPGYIGEHVEKHGGKEFVLYNEQGQVEEVMYDRIALAQIQVLKRKNEALESRVAALEAA